MCAGFASLGHSVTLWAVDGASPARANAGSLHADYGVPASFQVRLLKRSPFPFPLEGSLSSLRMVLSVRRESPDLIYGRNLIAMWLSTFLDVPLVFEAHAVPKGAIKKYAFSRLRRSPNLKKIVTISDELGRQYQALSGLGKKIVVAPSGSFNGHSNRESSTSSRDSSSFTVGYAGAFFPGRGLDLILGLADQLPSVRFKICGGSRDELSALLKQSEIPSNLKVEGRLKPNRVPAFLSGCDALLAPYQEVVGLSGVGDSAGVMSPLKIFEYMKSKRPIIASNLPVLREVLVANVNALVCESTSLKEWVQAIEFLMVNSSVGQQLSTRAFADFELLFSTERRAALVLSGLETDGNRW